jgi:hypothetical protein
MAAVESGGFGPIDVDLVRPQRGSAHPLSGQTDSSIQKLDTVSLGPISVNPDRHLDENHERR